MMEEKRSIWSRLFAIVAGIIYVFFGILMIQNPNTTLATLSLVMGWVVTISGIVAIVYAIKFKDVPEVHTTSLTEGILLLLLGLVFLFGNFISNTLVLAYLLLFWLIVDSAAQLQFASALPASFMKYLLMVLDVCIIAYGIFLLFQPATAEAFLVFYTGFAFVSTGVTKFIKAF